MPVTLAQAKVNMKDKVDISVIDQFRRNSLILDNLVFDDAVSAGTGGSTLVYGYTRLKGVGKAGGRAINEEYTAQEAEKELKTTNLTIMGGSFKIDRVIANTSGKVDEVNFQLEQKIKGTINEFQNNFINGDYTTSSGKSFDGLKKLLEGSDTEIDASSVDVSGAMTQEKAEALCEALDEAMLELIRKPDFIATSKKGLVKLKAAARMLGYLTRSEDAFGNQVDTYNGVPIVDLGSYYNGSSAATEIISTATNKTDIYMWCQGLDAVHGVSVKGDKIISTNLPDFTTAGAVKEGDVEFVAAIALKNTRGACRLKDITVTSA